MSRSLLLLGLVASSLAACHGHADHHDDPLAAHDSHDAAPAADAAPLASEAGATARPPVGAPATPPAGAAAAAVFKFIGKELGKKVLSSALEKPISKAWSAVAGVVGISLDPTTEELIADVRTSISNLQSEVGRLANETRNDIRLLGIKIELDGDTQQVEDHLLAISALFGGDKASCSSDSLLYTTGLCKAPGATAPPPPPNEAQRDQMLKTIANKNPYENATRIYKKVMGPVQLHHADPVLGEDGSPVADGFFLKMAQAEIARMGSSPNEVGDDAVAKAFERLHTAFGTIVGHNAQVVELLAVRRALSVESAARKKTAETYTADRLEHDVAQLARMTSYEADAYIQAVAALAGMVSSNPAAIRLPIDGTTPMSPRATTELAFALRLALYARDFIPRGPTVTADVQQLLMDTSPDAVLTYEPRAMAQVAFLVREADLPKLATGRSGFLAPVTASYKADKKVPFRSVVTVAMRYVKIDTGSYGRYATFQRELERASGDAVKVTPRSSWVLIYGRIPRAGVAKTAKVELSGVNVSIPFGNAVATPKFPSAAKYDEATLARPVEEDVWVANLANAGPTSDASWKGEKRTNQYALLVPATHATGGDHPFSASVETKENVSQDRGADTWNNVELRGTLPGAWSFWGELDVERSYIREVGRKLPEEPAPSACSDTVHFTNVLRIGSNFDSADQSVQLLGARAPFIGTAGELPKDFRSEDYRLAVVKTREVARRDFPSSSLRVIAFDCEDARNGLALVRSGREATNLGASMRLGLQVGFNGNGFVSDVRSNTVRGSNLTGADMRWINKTSVLRLGLYQRLAP